MIPWIWVIMDVQPPSNRRGPPRSETHVEQGKPIVPPETAGEPRGTLLVLWVEELGRSECLLVMSRIRTEILFDAKAGRLPNGRSSQERF